MMLFPDKFKNLSSILIILALHFIVGLITLLWAQSEEIGQSNSAEGRVLIVANLAYFRLLGNNQPAFKIKNYQNHYWVDKSSAKLVERKDFNDIEKTRAIVVMLAPAKNETEESIRILINQFPTNIHFFWLSLPLNNQSDPNISNTEINEFNQKIKSLCAEYGNCNFVDLTLFMKQKSENVLPNSNTNNINQIPILNEILNSLIP